MMIAGLRHLRVGQEVWAVVEENIAGGEAIINFTGDLVRVQNLTEKPLRPGQRVLLQVQALKPLKLKIVVRRASQPFSRQKLDLSI
jgi:hypothetical protein